MASTLQAGLCALAAVLFWTALGLPVARALAPRPLATAIAPALGWALYSVAALPIFLIVGFSTTTAFALSAIALLASFVALVAQRGSPAEGHDGALAGWPLALAAAGAALLAMGPAVALLPKIGSEGVAFAAPMFDHAKIAIIDEMTRMGLPPGNPFFGEAGATLPRLAYYYLWHFSAAAMALQTGVSGWEADIAVTWFTAFASLMLMIGLACWYSARASTAVWVLLLCAAASVRWIPQQVFSAATLERYLEPASGFAGWLFQAAWVPQHMASASCAVLAVFVLSRLARRPSVTGLVTLGLLVAAAYESSTWIGAIVIPFATLAAGMLLLIYATPGRRWRFVAAAAAAAAITIGLSAPMLYDQYLATAMRDGGSPIALHFYPVLGKAWPEPLRHILDLPAYWSLFLWIEFPAIYLAGLAMLAISLREKNADPDRAAATLGFAALAGASLVVAWLFVSTIGENNDLGWRAILPGVLVLTVFAAAGLSRWLARGARLAAFAVFAGLLLGLPEGFSLIYGNAVGSLDRDGKAFAATPEMWAAVRRHAGLAERVADNPRLLEGVVPWSVNLSWALLANRRSCFAGRELTLAYTPLPNAQRMAIEAQFVRVFVGNPAEGDLRDLAIRYDCRVVVMTAQDKGWTRDPFAASPLYRLVETKPGAWRIYRSTMAEAVKFR